ncbi:aminotransferase class III-fold pyridoxal phosphate-dependent enzyme [Aeromicrobium sp. IC_218]|uniref:aspartate aminotransferase family protein n=1 Tax=Aeromicrobium sp. IC_218 TaxID=2545468 RepID=UPI001A954AEB|nr:aminotransferase class III-fold pyridoxal phosphate-dependent enzyme [Aeromicrobium sp. IC_218]
MTGPEQAAYADHPLAARARAVMPGGNTRSTLFVPPTPPFAVRGEGAWVEDQLGHRVLDCNNNYTALVHGHAFEPVQRAVADVVPRGTAFGLPTGEDVALAELLQQRTGLDLWRFSNSGTEAVMTALRGARAATGRDVIIRFAGSYHGTTDAVVDVAAPGVPAAVGQTVVVVPQGDRAAYDAALAEHGDDLAGVLVDLMPNRAGLVPADPDFVTHLRETTRRLGAVLVVDEVITYRLGVGGLHQRYGIEPDLVTFGKVIGGGYPVGGLGGRAEIMDVFDPRRSGAVGWGGTFSANPVTMTAGRVALEHLDETAIARLDRLGELLRGLLAEGGVAATGGGSLTRLREPVDVGELWWQAYRRGVMAGTNGLVALSTPMTEDDVRTIASALVDAVRTVKKETPA